MNSATLNKIVYILVLIIVATVLSLVRMNSACAGELPDKTMTPGAINPAVNQDNIQSTICVSGFTKNIRPSVGITNKIKLALMHENGLDGQDPHKWELDHLISLEIGGNPSAKGNLWLQSWTGSCNARQKDVLETKLKRLVCSNQILLAQAQSEISDNWIAAYSKFVNPAGCE